MDILHGRKTELSHRSETTHTNVRGFKRNEKIDVKRNSGSLLLTLVGLHHVDYFGDGGRASMQAGGTVTIASNDWRQVSVY